jgi:hypothetical protein
LVQIREIRESDAERYLNLYEKLIRETDFLLLEPGERNSTIDDQRKRIVTFLESENSTIFVVEHEGEIVGHLVAIGGHNESAVALYKKMGFEIEGIKKHSLLVREQYADEFYNSCR